jgi:hypothetical protein
VCCHVLLCAQLAGFSVAYAEQVGEDFACFTRWMKQL